MIADRFALARRDPRCAVLEGFHPLKHAVRFGAEIVEAVSPDPPAVVRLAERLAPDVAECLAGSVAPVPPDVFARLVPDPGNAAVAALAVRPRWQVQDFAALPGRIVYLEDPSHLGNIGASIRVAAAAGAAGVLTSGDRDPWHATAIRGSAGLHFALAVARAGSLPDAGRPIVAFHPAGLPLAPGILPAEALAAFGSERRGLSAALLDRADLHVAIPMRPGVSSLNLATAVAVALYAG